MNASAAKRLVEAYLDAIESRDYEGARQLLADDGFEYSSPMSRFSSPDDFIQYISLMGGIVHDIQRVKVFVDGEDICHFLIFVSQISEKESTKLVQWARVRDGRIKRIEVLFDTHKYRQMLEPGE